MPEQTPPPFRRPVSRRLVLGGIGALLVQACAGSDDDEAAEVTTTTARPAPAGVALVAPLAATPDQHGLLLPAGWESRIVATGGEPVAGTGYEWPPFPDGAATFADPAVEGGWYATVNHEISPDLGGGVSALRFDPEGTVIDAYRLLGGTNRNCAGGGTPWGTWLSCEEIEGGRVFECDPAVPDSGEERPALGRFVHEAVCVDPEDEVLYLTEDTPDGLFYRFTPRAYPDLSEGRLEVAAVTDGEVSWLEVPDPAATSTPTRQQVAGATAFDGGEGIACGPTPDGRRVWFSTKGDDTVWELDPAASTLRVLYRPGSDPVLRGVDNLWWDEPAGLLYVAEDGDDMQVVALDLTGAVAPLLQVVGHDGSEVTGPVLDPRRTTLQFSSQRGVGGQTPGVTFAVRGEFPTAG